MKYGGVTRNAECGMRNAEVRNAKCEMRKAGCGMRHMKHAEGVPETVELSDGSRAPAERKIVGKSITYGQAHRL